ncbi:MAG TPA: type III-B CRISPR module RAMP protein Cmr4 [Candidatus Obscuribacterales bacterium]
MFEKAEMLYIYVETPLHAGSGSSVGVVDLPIQRERVTNYPLVQASGIKGKLRAEAADVLKRENDADAAKKVAVVFGPKNSDHAGALSPGDARLLLFPVRSLVGVFAWATSNNVLARLKRDLASAGKTVPWTIGDPPGNGETLTVDDKSIVASGSVVLEEFAFKATSQGWVKTVAEWLAANAFPQTDDYKYFREKVQTSLVILHEDAFRDFTQFSTEVVTRIRIDQTTKTAAKQKLWSEEHLPSDTLLYAPMHASRPRTDNTPNGLKTADDVLKVVRDLNLDRIQLGGDETVGRGIVKLHFGGGQS